MAFDTGGYDYGTVSVGVTVATVSDGVSRRKSILIQNCHASNKVYVGPSSSVATSTGLRLGPNDSVEVSDVQGPIYAIADGASTDVRFWEMG